MAADKNQLKTRVTRIYCDTCRDFVETEVTVSIDRLRHYFTCPECDNFGIKESELGRSLRFQAMVLGKQFNPGSFDEATAKRAEALELGPEMKVSPLIEAVARGKITADQLNHAQWELWQRGYLSPECGCP